MLLSIRRVCYVKAINFKTILSKNVFSGNDEVIVIHILLSNVKLLQDNSDNFLHALLIAFERNTLRILPHWTKSFSTPEVMATSIYFLMRANE